SYDLAQLGNSWVGPNFDSAARGPLYVGAHNDADGNVIFPAQNGYGGAYPEGAYLFGDSRYPLKTVGGLVVGANGGIIKTNLRGTVALSGATDVAVSFGVALSNSTYQVALSASA